VLLEPLPIDPHLPDIVNSLRGHGGLVIVAPPGAGKTTRVPRAIHESGIAGSGEILVLQPRRLATRLAAMRVAAEMGESPGSTVGFAIRFETLGGPQTRIRFVTEGVLSRRIIGDPQLHGVAVVILDEFHERHLATDLALALLRRLQRRERPDLKLLAMSATMDPAPVAAFLGDSPVYCVEGRRFPVTTEFQGKADDRPLQDQVAAAISRLVRENCAGDILVFLPGASEIRQSAEALRALKAGDGLAVFPLHGDLSPSQQQMAIAPCAGRKVLLATNVAETSVTVPGIAAVLDSGLARVAVHSAWTGIPSLRLVKISKASAEQRAGRAGRTQSGRVLRLYTQGDFESRQEHDQPEIRRSDLCETLLTLHGSGIANAADLRWFEPPPDSAISAARGLLNELSAVDDDGNLTETGRRMLRFPVHPRLARLIVEGERQDVADEALRLASLLSERDLRLDARSELTAGRRRPQTGFLGSSDLVDLLDRFAEAESVHFEPRRIRSLGLDPGTTDRVRRAYRQLQRLRSGRSRSVGRANDPDSGVRISVLAAFPDRVAKRRARGSRDLLLAGGGVARLSDASIVHEASLMVAVDVEERVGRQGLRAGSETLIRLASAVEPEWLAGLFPKKLRQEDALFWNERAARVDEIRRTAYGQISLEESVRPATPSRAASDMLAEAILKRGLESMRDSSRISELRARLALLAVSHPGEQILNPDAEALKSILHSICVGKRSIAEVAEVSLFDSVLAKLSQRQRGMLEREVPDLVNLGSRRNLKVHYEEGKPPWIESRLQDFFGLRSTPTICSGKIHLSVRLLAPNGRPVQITQDLGSFWRQHYPAVRRELQRRYPKHAWPSPEEI
jgi:ATP-dependent helicase HrpB